MVDDGDGMPVDDSTPEGVEARDVLDAPDGAGVGAAAQPASPTAPKTTTPTGRRILRVPTAYLRSPEVLASQRRSAAA
jgi:hypothetical protein